MELKPCPFCGGKAEFERIGDHMQSCIVACEDCGCTLESNETDDSCGRQWNERRPPKGRYFRECYNDLCPKHDSFIDKHNGPFATCDGICPNRE